METIKDFWWGVIDTKTDRVVATFASKAKAEFHAREYEMDYNLQVEQVRVTVDRIKTS